MPARVDIRISDNADWTKVFTFEDEDGNAIDLTGSTFEMDIRETVDATAEIATLTTSNGRLALSASPTDGKLTVLIPAGIAPAGANGATAHYVHDLKRTLSTVTERLWFGALDVVKGVSRT